MSDFRSRLSERLQSLGKTPAEASTDGKLSKDAIRKILALPHHSPTLETVQKLAVGLETSPEWLAWGLGSGADDGVTAAKALMPPANMRPLRNNDCIQVEIGDFDRLAADALRTGKVAERRIPVLVRALLEALRECPGSSVVLRSYAPDRNVSESQGPTTDDRA